MSGELEYSALTIWAGGDDSDVCRVVDRCNDAGCQNDLLPIERGKFNCQDLDGEVLLQLLHIPCLSDVDHIDPIWAGLPEIWLHMDLEILRAEMTLSCKQHLDILGGSIENGG